MPKGRSHLQVPVFTRAHLDQAADCSMLLWEGVDYETGKDMETSDCEFLEEFYLAFELKRLYPGSKLTIDEDVLRRLIRLGKLKAMFRSTNPIDFGNGLKCIESLISRYDSWLHKQVKPPLDEFLHDFGVELGRSFVTANSGPVINGNYRIPFASRILFFGFPMMPFFSFSNSLSSKMLFQTRPQAALKSFNAELVRGFIANDLLLSKTPVPSAPQSIDAASWSRILACKWWERRVFDIALLLHFGITHKSSTITLKATGASSLTAWVTRANQAKLHEARLLGYNLPKPL
jgi:hypothetical protein